MNRTFVIGDIHGCHKALVALLAKINPDPATDTIVFLGDYVDRGSDSRAVVAEIIALREKNQRVITLMGNHEEMFLRFLAGDDQDFFLGMGGRQTLASYGVDPPYSRQALAAIPVAHLQFYNELLTMWEDEHAIYVHAGLKPGVHLSQQPREWLLWARDNYLATGYDFGRPVVSGHTPFRAPLVEKQKIIIDTGAVYGGQLTCLVLPDMEFVRTAGEAGLDYPFR
jgi:serine/threonine protein phosphatase 1